MSVDNQDLTLHEFWHRRVASPNCEYCAEKVHAIAQRWYLKKWISYQNYLDLTGLPF